MANTALFTNFNTYPSFSPGLMLIQNWKNQYSFQVGLKTSVEDVDRYEK